MSRTTDTPDQPAPLARLSDRVDDARRFAAEQERGKTWKVLPGSRSIGFMDLRNSMCRWPVSDPLHPDTVRYCGCACGPEVSYCEDHRKIAAVPNRVRTPAAKPPQETQA